MMKNFLIRIVVVFLLFSVTAETFSSLFFTNSEQVSFAEKDEQGKDAQKDKDDTYKEEFKDKYFTSGMVLSVRKDPASLYAGYAHPELICRQCDPPEIPPEQI